MSTPKINEGRLILAVMFGLSIIGTTLSCGGRTMIRIGGLSEYDKQTILDMHNRMRQSVALGQIRGQPPAKNMMEMKWDNELAAGAQRWATSCFSYTHDQGRHISRFLVGQNIASTWTTKQPSSYYDMQPEFVTDAISKWFNEFQRYDYSGYRGGHTGHYTQMIWAESNTIGCGYAFYLDPSKGFTKNYVCNYGPSGNVAGQTPYEKGYPSCYVYTLSESGKYSGLCDTRHNYGYEFENYIG